MEGFMNKKRGGPKLGKSQSNKAVKPKNDGSGPMAKNLLGKGKAKGNKGFVNKAGKIS